MREPLRVFFVGGDGPNANRLRSYLNNLGFDVTIASPREAIESLSAERSADWGMVLVDESVSSADALDVYTILRDRGGRERVHVVSFRDTELIVTRSFCPYSGDVIAANGGIHLGDAVNAVLTSTRHDAVGDRQDTGQALAGIMRAGLSEIDLQTFFSRAVSVISTVVKIDAAYIFLRERLSGELNLSYFSGANEPVGEALRTIEKIARASKPATLPSPELTRFASFPLRTGVRTIGLIILESDTEGFPLGSKDTDFLSLAADQLAITIERRRADDALRESEGRYRMLFDHAPDGIVIADSLGVLLDSNASFRKELGYSAAEFLQLSASEIVAPREIPEIETALGEIAQKAEHHREWNFKRKDGSNFAADVSATRMPDGNILAIVRDLSESRKAELERAVLAAEVEVQRERLKNIVAHVPGIVWETTADPVTGLHLGNFVSEYITEMLGYTVNEWLAKPDFWPSIVHPDCKRKSEAVGALLTGGKRVQEIPLIAKNGRVVWVEAHSAAIVGADETIEGTRGVMIGINERKRSEKALRTSEERYRDLVENAIDIIYVHDLQGNYTSVNQAAERITGYTRDEILGMNMSRSMAPEYLEKAREMIASKLAGKAVTAYEVEVLAKDGRRIALEVNTRLVYDNGVPVAIQGIARDTTERRLLEEKYRQSQKLEAVGLLAGGISHDFNNLLTAIIGYSEITLARMSSDDPLRPNLEEIKEIGERASVLTRQLLAFSRKQALKPVVHNLNAVIMNMDKMLRRIVREDIEFQINLGRDLGNVEADPGQLEQVIVNLAINAQDAMPDGGRLTISTESVHFDDALSSDSAKLGIGPFVRMTVADTGDGIDEQIQERIFEPFFTTKASGKGSGLGLSTVHGIVKQSGGEILVHSSKGKGTTFEIYLPAIGRNAESGDWSSGKTGDFAGSETVLLVEDDRAVRNLVREILVDSGYKVLEASSGELALAICGERKEPIHMLLTDLVMPHMSGIELTSRVRSSHPEAKPLVMTGYPSDSAVRESIPDFGATFIEKPFTPEDLARKVREVLDLRSTK